MTPYPPLALGRQRLRVSAWEYALTLEFIESNRLMGVGLGCIDVHALASANLALLPRSASAGTTEVNPNLPLRM